MTEYNWADLRQRATLLFNGETPRPHLEQEIIEVFTEQPDLVNNAIGQIGGQFATGTIRSGWAVLRTHVINAELAQRTNVTATSTNNREKRISQAEQWIRTAGIHFDQESEVDDELFGDRGLLREWPDLRDRILETWRQARPIGEQLEQDLHDRSEHWKNTTGLMHQARNAKRAQQDAADLISRSMPNDLPAELREPQETT